MAAAAIVMNAAGTMPRFDRNHAVQVPLGNNDRLDSGGLDAEAHARRQAAQSRLHERQEQARRRKARQLQLAAAEQALGRREAERMEKRMRDRVEWLSAQRPEFQDMVLRSEHALCIDSEGRINCVYSEYWVPRRVRPDPRTVPAVSPAYSGWPPWYGTP